MKQNNDININNNNIKYNPEENSVKDNQFDDISSENITCLFRNQAEIDKINNSNLKILRKETLKNITTSHNNNITSYSLSFVLLLFLINIINEITSCGRNGLDVLLDTPENIYDSVLTVKMFNIFSNTGYPEIITLFLLEGIFLYIIFRGFEKISQMIFLRIRQGSANYK